MDLHELSAGDADAEWAALRDLFVEGLALYESVRWSKACQERYPLRIEPESQDDLPTPTLLGRAVVCLKAPPAALDPEFARCD